ncbi:MAG: TPM domain-containing protein [Cyclobacteriaceae bacterium]|nr:TPM domain-containing protein [Cyclobacteriaceae bacterium]
MKIFFTLFAGFWFFACSSNDGLPKYKAPVVDDAGIISDGQEKGLSKLIDELKENTGVELAILTVASLEGEPIGKYTERVFKKWSPGSKDRQDGILIVVAKEEKFVRIETGLGLQRIVRRQNTEWIVNYEISPEFKEGRYYQGLEKAVKSLGVLIIAEKDKIGQM